MPFRRILLHIMLWSLAVGAILGAVTVLTNGGVAFWRISGTTFATAVAAGLLIPISRLVDRTVTRPVGLMGMSLVIIEFLLALPAIWGLYPAWAGTAMAMTLGFLPVCGLFAAIMLRVGLGDPRGRLSGVVGVLVAIACFLMIMGAAWLTSIWDIRQKALSSAGTLGAFGIALAACLAGGSPWPRFHWALTAGRGLGAAAAVVGAGASLYAIWNNIYIGSWEFRAVTSIAAVIAHANLCLLVPLTSGQRWVRLLTVAGGVGTAVSLNLAMFPGLSRGDAEFAMRIASAGGIITSCGSLALLVLARINRRIPCETRVLTSITEMRVICPGCGRKEFLKVGRSECPSCRLGFEIRIEEPRCPKCEYLLFMLKSDKCPECGEVLTSLHA